MPPLHAHLPLRVRVWFAGPALDRRLAVGEDPFSDPALAYRAAALLSKRACQTIVRGLERVMSEEPKQRGLSASVAVDYQAVEIARPALGQLALALRSRDLIRPQGVALAQTLLTDPCSALYHAENTDRLYENAREALIALGPGPAAAPAPEEEGESHGCLAGEFDAP